MINYCIKPIYHAVRMTCAGWCAYAWWLRTFWVSELEWTVYCGSLRQHQLHPVITYCMHESPDSPNTVQMVPKLLVLGPPKKSPTRACVMYCTSVACNWMHKGVIVVSCCILLFCIRWNHIGLHIILLWNFPEVSNEQTNVCRHDQDCLNPKQISQPWLGPNWVLR